MRALILGLGISGRSAGEFLEKHGIAFEFAKSADIECKKFEKQYLDRLFDGLSFIVTSPGIDPNLELLKQARLRKIKIVCEFELGACQIKGDIIAVTGTNGKTTTVSLIGFLLKNYDAGKVYLGGNIGIPVTSFAGQTGPEDISVLECSSYQLEYAKNFHPHIAAILNLSVDHLARHGTFEKYIRAKLSITKNQTASDFLLLNADCETIMEHLPKTEAQVYYFSTKRKVVGCYIKNKCIYFNDNQGEVKLVSVRKIKLIGEHNLSNILCAVLAVWLKTKNKKHLNFVHDFVGVPHRTEFVKKIGGIDFYNDSKATNIDSTIVATKSFSGKINLILGGSDKGYEFDELFAKMPKNVKKIAVFGQTKSKILSAAARANFTEIYSFDNLKQCTIFCYKSAKKGEIVLLSPACASFDFFLNFEHRGAVFKKIVEEISQNENVDLGESEETKI